MDSLKMEDMPCNRCGWHVVEVSYDGTPSCMWCSAVGTELWNDPNPMVVALRQEIERLKQDTLKSLVGLTKEIRDYGY